MEYKDKNSDILEVTSNFKGRFLNIGIKSRDKDMLVPFPVSVLSWNNKGIQAKQYLTVTHPDIDIED